MQRIFNDLLMGNSLFLYSDTFTILLLYCLYMITFDSGHPILQSLNEEDRLVTGRCL
jgi:hypothetical protein